MSSTERPSEKAKETEFSYLKYMRGVREALEAQITETYGAFDLGRLEQAPSEDQKSLIEKALETARVKYDEESNHVKLVELKEVKEALGEGRLTLSGLLEGLEFKARQVGRGRGRSFIDRIRDSLGKTIRT